MRDCPSIHPGEILEEEFLKPMSISQRQLASDLGLPKSQIDQVARGEMGIDADMALRLARYFGMSVEFWTGIQTHYEVEMAKVDTSLGRHSLIRVSC